MTEHSEIRVDQATPVRAPREFESQADARAQNELEVFKAFGAFPGKRIFNRLAALGFVGGAGYLLVMAYLHG